MAHKLSATTFALAAVIASICTAEQNWRDPRCSMRSRLSHLSGCMACLGGTTEDRKTARTGKIGSW